LNELIHSSSALNVLSKFHNKCVIYVEGTDDRTFWGYFFESIAQNKFHIKVAGGVEELKKYAQMVVSDDIDVIIASDSHYDVLFGIHTQHKKIVYTEGHSIENIMYCPNNLNKAIRKRCRLDYTPFDTAHIWIEAFCEDLMELLVFDMANEFYGKGISVMSTSCERFLKRRGSPNLSKEKVEDFLNKIRIKFQEQEIATIKNSIEKSEIPVHRIVRGKFLRNGIINLIKQESRKVGKGNKTFTRDDLFDLTVDGCQSCNEHCDGYRNMCQSCIDAVNSLNN